MTRIMPTNAWNQIGNLTSIKYDNNVEYLMLPQQQVRGMLLWRTFSTISNLSVYPTRPQDHHHHRHHWIRINREERMMRCLHVLHLICAKTWPRLGCWLLCLNVLHLVHVRRLIKIKQIKWRKKRFWLLLLLLLLFMNLNTCNYYSKSIM